MKPVYKRDAAEDYFKRNFNYTNDIAELLGREWLAEPRYTIFQKWSYGYRFNFIAGLTGQQIDLFTMSGELLAANISEVYPEKVSTALSDIVITVRAGGKWMWFYEGDFYNTKSKVYHRSPEYDRLNIIRDTVVTSFSLITAKEGEQARYNVLGHKQAELTAYEFKQPKHQALSETSLFASVEIKQETEKQVAVSKPEKSADEELSSRQLKKLEKQKQEEKEQARLEQEKRDAAFEALKAKVEASRVNVEEADEKSSVVVKNEEQLAEKPVKDTINITALKKLSEELSVLADADRADVKEETIGDIKNEKEQVAQTSKLEAEAKDVAAEKQKEIEKLRAQIEAQEKARKEAEQKAAAEKARVAELEKARQQAEAKAKAEQAEKEAREKEIQLLKAQLAEEKNARLQSEEQMAIETQRLLDEEKERAEAKAREKVWDELQKKAEQEQERKAIEQKQKFETEQKAENERLRIETEKQLKAAAEKLKTERLRKEDEERNAEVAKLLKEKEDQAKLEKAKRQEEEKARIAAEEKAEAERKEKERIIQELKKLKEAEEREKAEAVAETNRLADEEKVRLAAEAAKEQLKKEEQERKSAELKTTKETEQKTPATGEMLTDRNVIMQKILERDKLLKYVVYKEKDLFGLMSVEGKVLIYPVMKSMQIVHPTNPELKYKSVNASIEFEFSGQIFHIMKSDFDGPENLGRHVVKCTDCKSGFKSVQLLWEKGKYVLKSDLN